MESQPVCRGAGIRRAQGPGGGPAPAGHVAGSAALARTAPAMNILAVLTYLTRNAGGMYESVRALHQATAQLPGVAASACGVADEFIHIDLSAWEPVPVKAFKIYGPRQFQYAPGMRRYLLEA